MARQDYRLDRFTHDVAALLLELSQAKLPLVDRLDVPLLRRLERPLAACPGSGSEGEVQTRDRAGARASDQLPNPSQTRCMTARARPRHIIEST